MPSGSGGTSSPSQNPPRWPNIHPAPVGHRAQKAAGCRDKLICCQYHAGRGRRGTGGIDEQVAKAEKAVAGIVRVEPNRLITLAGRQTSVDHEFETKARALAGLKGYTTNLAACPDGIPVTTEFVISAYHQLFQIETGESQCGHSRDWSALSSVPSCSVFIRAA
jgi:hypothetical protein